MGNRANKAILVKLTAALLFSLAFILFYIYHDVGPRPDFVVPRRINQVVAMVLVSVCISYATVIFQTITNNRILTPGIIGFEAVYMFIQTVIVFVLGGDSHFVTTHPNFFLSVGMMMLFSLLVYQFMFRKEGNNVFFLLLVGMVLGVMFSSLTSFMHMVIDPNEFWIIQGRMFASFNRINSDLLFISAIVVGITLVASLPFAKYLDAMSLGKENAINLGVSHKKVSKAFLLIIAVLVSVSTALVGPVTFLGILVANLAYQLLATYRHRYLLPMSFFITVIVVVGGQFLVSRVLNFSTTISIVINLFGGLYFLGLLLKGKKGA